MRILVFLLISGSVTSLAHAQAETPAPVSTPKPVPPWKGAIEAGATETSGNTNVRTYTGALKLDGAHRGWGLAIRSNGVHAETEDIQTAGAWDASVRGDRTITGILGAYVRLSIDGDRFKGIENRKGAGAGLSAAKKWAAHEGSYDSAGVRAELGYQFYREDLVATDEDHDVNAVRAFVGLFKAISRESSLSEEAEVLYDPDNDGRYLVTSVTALTVKLRKSLALKISETVKMDTEPPLTDPANPDSDRFEEVDTLTALALQLSF